MGLNFIDTHSHLYAAEFDTDIEAAVERCLSSNVYKVLLPGIDQSSFKAMNKLTDRWPGIFHAMMGLHPCSVQPETYQAELSFVQKELQENDYLAIGEIGMDLYWDKSTYDIQKEALQTQLTWASEMKLPVAIHSRNATQEVIDIIRELQLDNLTGVFHCFGDGLKEAKQIIELGFMMGIGGVLTFKNSGLDKVIAEVDLKHLILETDSPYLAPIPYRGKRNESSYIPLIAQKLADVKQTSIENVAEITTRNAKELFSI